MPLQSSSFYSEKSCLLAAVSETDFSYPKPEIISADLFYHPYNTMSSQELQALFYIKFQLMMLLRRSQ
ncbi:MAG: hypothetical protein AB4063_21825 [Crocosphaera sp.]